MGNNITTEICLSIFIIAIIAIAKIISKKDTTIKNEREVEVSSFNNNEQIQKETHQDYRIDISSIEKDIRIIRKWMQFFGYLTIIGIVIYLLYLLTLVP